MRKYLLVASALCLTAPASAAPPAPIATGSIEAIIPIAEAAYKCGIEALSIQKYSDQVALFVATSRATPDAMNCARDWIAANATRLGIKSYFRAPNPPPQKDAATDPLEIEFWRVGDDGLSNRFHQAVSDSVKSSGRFSEGGKKGASLIFYAPTNVDWKDVGGRTEVQYTFEFWRPKERTGLDVFKPTEMGSLIDKMEGTCWEDEMPKCAEAIVERAKKVAAKQ